MTMQAHADGALWLAAVEALDTGVLILDEDGQVLSANATVLAWLGGVLRERQIRPLCRNGLLLRPGDVARIGKAVLALRKGATGVLNCKAEARDRSRWYSLRLRRLELAGPARLLLSLDDESHCQRTEMALRASRRELHQLIEHCERLKENERKRIARDIHDDLGQSMLALRMEADMLAARTSSAHPRLHRRTQTALTHIDTTIKSVRSIINSLRPPVLELGLQAALEWQARQFSARTGVACALDVSDVYAEPQLDEAKTLAMFRIVQEALANVAEHAQASRVDIALRCSGGHLGLSVADDGVGMGDAGARKPDAFGLLGVRAKVTALDGQFSIARGAGELGTVLTIIVPLAPTDD